MERAGVSEQAAAAAEIAYRLDKKIPDGSRVNYPDRIYREVRERPLLILFNIAVKATDLAAEARARVPEEPVVGWGISFPISDRPNEKVEYILNTTKLRELFGEDDTDEGQVDDEE
jgi:hypothetical protein